MEETKKAPLCDMFGGPDALAQNALYSAIDDCGGYKFLQDAPRASGTVRIVDALQERGFTIVKTASKDLKLEAGINPFLKMLIEPDLTNAIKKYPELAARKIFKLEEDLIKLRNANAKLTSQLGSD